jgi:hypothetical protein
VNLFVSFTNVQQRLEPDKYTVHCTAALSAPGK